MNDQWSYCRTRKGITIFPLPHDHEINPAKVFESFPAAQRAATEVVNEEIDVLLRLRGKLIAAHQVDSAGIALEVSDEAASLQR